VACSVYLDDFSYSRWNLSRNSFPLSSIVSPHHFSSFWKGAFFSWLISPFDSRINWIVKTHSSNQITFDYQLIWMCFYLRMSSLLLLIDDIFVFEQVVLTFTVAVISFC
jgi:hypothetical protein